MDEVDKLHADMERRLKMNSVVRARLAKVERNIPPLLERAQRIHMDDEMYVKDFATYEERRRQIQAISVTLKSLFDEHAALEAVSDRERTQRLSVCAFTISLVSFVLALFK